MLSSGHLTISADMSSKEKIDFILEGLDCQNLDYFEIGQKLVQMESRNIPVGDLIQDLADHLIPIVKNVVIRTNRWLCHDFNSFAAGQQFANVFNWKKSNQPQTKPRFNPDFAIPIPWNLAGCHVKHITDLPPPFKNPVVLDPCRQVNGNTRKSAHNFMGSVIESLLAQCCSPAEKIQNYTFRTRVERNQKDSAYLNLPEEIVNSLQNICLDLFDLNGHILQNHTLSQEELNKFQEYLSLGQTEEERFSSLVARRKLRENIVRNGFAVKLKTAMQELRLATFQDVNGVVVVKKRSTNTSALKRPSGRMLGDDDDNTVDPNTE